MSALGQQIPFHPGRPNDRFAPIADIAFEDVQPRVGWL